MKTQTSMKNVEGNIQGFILSIVGVAVVLAVGLIVLSQLQTNAIAIPGGVGGPANASVASIITQLATVPNWIGIIITVALAFIVLGYFYNRM
jgi:uncharacterized membrane protein